MCVYSVSFSTCCADLGSWSVLGRWLLDNDRFKLLALIKLHRLALMEICSYPHAVRIMLHHVASLFLRELYQSNLLAKPESEVHKKPCAVIILDDLDDACALRNARVILEYNCVTFAPVLTCLGVFLLLFSYEELTYAHFEDFPLGMGNSRG